MGFVVPKGVIHLLKQFLLLNESDHSVMIPGTPFAHGRSFSHDGDTKPLI